MENLRKLIRGCRTFRSPASIFSTSQHCFSTLKVSKGRSTRSPSSVRGMNIDTVIGVESRGFIFASPLAYQLGVGFVPVRKPKKLPAECVTIEYQLEYGTDTLEMHKDAVGEGHNVLIVDDLLATGGTARAVVDLVESVGGKVAGLLFVVELDFLNGRGKFDGYEVKSLIHYSE